MKLQYKKTFPKRIEALLIINEINDEQNIIDLDIFLEDGSVAYFYNDPGYILLNLFQSRLDKNLRGIKNYVDIWDNLAEGKVYLKDYPIMQSINSKMILEALNWLRFPNNGFEIFWNYKIENEDLISLINEFFKKISRNS
ncbi:MAG: hypothetical protein P8Y97_10855 [Candidatus Lokiarchaeota archaeon]